MNEDNISILRLAVEGVNGQIYVVGNLVKPVGYSPTCFLIFCYFLSHLRKTNRITLVINTLFLEYSEISFNRVKKSSGLQVQLLSPAHLHLRLINIVNKWISTSWTLIEIFGLLKSIIYEGVNDWKTHLDLHGVLIFYIYSEIVHI